MSTPLDPDQKRASSYLEVQRSQEFLDLRARFRKFVFPVTGLFLGWYFLYVLLAAFAPAFMSYKLVGNLNVVGVVSGAEEALRWLRDSAADLLLVACAG